MNMQKTHHLWLSILLIFSTICECRPAQRYQVRGLLLEVSPKSHEIVVSSEAIPGFMEAMKMSYQVNASEDLDRLKAGSTVQFALTVDGDRSLVSNIRILAFDSVDREPLQAKSLAILDQALTTKGKAQVIGVDQRVPDFTLVDQTGKRVALSQFAGKVVAVTFVYTRCPLPDYCFRLSSNFGSLQKKFQRQMGSDLVLLSITFDPKNDSPEVLARYGQIWKADAKGWHLLTGSPDMVKQVCRMFGSNFWPDEGAVTHSLHTFVIDRRGKLAANIEGNRFTTEQLADMVQTYLNEDGAGGKS